MSLVVLALLVGLWSAILLPGAIRARRASSPHSSVDAFREAMERLSARAAAEGAAGELLHPAAATAPAASGQGASGQGPPHPGEGERGQAGTVTAGDPAALREAAMRRAQRRRRVVAAVLGGGLALASTGMVALHPAFVWLLVVDVIAGAGYLGLLLGLRSRAEEARRKVMPLPERPPSPPPPASTGAALPQVAGEQQ